MTVGRVAELWRHPVKSMRGEGVDEVHLREAGVLGDRAWAVVDAASGLVASAKRTQRWGGLLAARASFVDEPSVDAPVPPVHVTLPDGRGADAGPDLDVLLSGWLGRDVQLAAADEGEHRIEKEMPAEDPTADGVVTGVLGAAAPGASFVDFAPVHLVTTAALRAADAGVAAGAGERRRWRPNLVLDVAGAGFPEDGWAGRRLRVGEAELEVVVPTPRCLVPGLAQPGVEAIDGAYRRLAAVHRVAVGTLGTLACLGAYARVTVAGPVRAGDVVELLPAG